MKTFSAKPQEVQRKWRLIDAEGQVLGRLATAIADILRGKDKPIFTPHVDAGDFVVVINAEKVVVTGRKAQQKEYQRYSGYPGGLRRIPYKRMLETHPERIIEHAVRGMIPHNRLGREIITKLKVYAGPEHPHGAQKPEPLVLEKR
jgi:large subunit ribosomal protein L13